MSDQKVRAKFKVINITPVDTSLYIDFKDKNLFNVGLLPVVGDPKTNKENAEFFAATPGGNINLDAVNEVVADQFEIGEEYYVDFTRAD